MSYEYKYLKYKKKIEKLLGGSDSKLDKGFDYLIKHKIPLEKIKRWTIHTHAIQLNRRYTSTIQPIYRISWKN